MIVEEVALDMQSVLDRLDELKSTSDKKRRAALIEASVSASIRGISTLAHEPAVADPAAYIANMRERVSGNIAGMTEELRHDQVRLERFVNTECDLLREMGATHGVVEKIRKDLTDILPSLRSGTVPHQGFAGRIADLVGVLQQDLRFSQRQDRQGRILRRLASAIEALGGGLVVVGNASAGATGALPAPLAELSIVFGSKLVDDGLSAAMAS